MMSVRRVKLLVPLVILLIVFIECFHYESKTVGLYNGLVDYLNEGDPKAVEDFNESDETDENAILKTKQDERLAKLLSQDNVSDLDIQTNNASQNFFKGIFQLYSENKPEHEIKINDNIEKEGKELTKEQLLKFITLNDEEIKSMKQKHANVYNKLPSQFPSLYRGNGIVYIGGGQFSWLSLLSISSLRETGSKLPVEVIIPSYKEYETEFCDLILPKLNSKCVVLVDFFGEEIMSHWDFKGYQYKSLGMIASSFSKILFLDSDNIIVSNPDGFFTNEVFESGMVIWPDYWKRTTSPHFYDIAGIRIENERARIGRFPLLHNIESDIHTTPYHDLKGNIPDLSSESGQIMIDKHTHTKTLLLSLYYNLYGPKYYYPLFSQGQQGEGDKDTFIAAAVRSHEPFYQIKSKIRTFGYFFKDKFTGIAMGQKNPVEDYTKFTKYESKLKNFGEQIELINNDEKVIEFEDDYGSIFAIHSNFPKLNPLALKDNGDLINEDGHFFRRYGDVKKYVGVDFELKQWEKINLFLCEMNLSFDDFNGIRRDELCQFIIEELIFLRRNPLV